MLYTCILTLWVEQDLHLQQRAGEHLDEVLYSQQTEHLSKREVSQWKLPYPWPLANNGLIYAMELERPPRCRQRHLIQDVVNIALQRQRGRSGCSDGPVQLRQETSAGMHERHGRDQTQSLGHVEGVPRWVVAASPAGRRWGGRRVGIDLIQIAGERVHAGGGGGWGGGRRVPRGVFCVVHLVKGLHGRANLWTGHLLVEGVNKAVCPRAVLLCDDEGVEPWFPLVCLCPEWQAFGHTQLQGRTAKNRRQQLVIQYWNKTLILW